MYDLIMAKWAAQRAVQDREAQSQSVEAILEKAALANAQLAVAKAVLTDLKPPADAAPQQKAEAEKQAQEIRREITDRLIFGSLPAVARVKPKKQSEQQVTVHVTLLLDTQAEIRITQPAMSPMPAGQVVQFAFL